MTPRTERADLDGWCLPLCTSSTIALANLDPQTAGLAQHYTQFGRTDVGARLTNALLARHSITSDPWDLTAADRITAELVSRTPAAPTAWITRAHVTTTTHRFAETMQVLALAAHHGATTEALVEERADVLDEEARDAFGEALERYAIPSPLPLTAMLYNWGHALQHARQHDEAMTASRTRICARPFTGPPSSHRMTTDARTRCAT